MKELNDKAVSNKLGMYDPSNIWRVCDFTKNPKHAYENIYLEVIRGFNEKKK